MNAKVLVEKSSSRRNAVNALIQYSKKIGSQAIVVSSHGRSGVGRLVFGSFAESLLAISPVPVVFLCEYGMNLRSEAPLKLHHRILFPTDLSETSKKALHLFLEQTQGYSGEIILYHAVSPPGAIADTGMVGIPIYIPENYWLDQRQWIERETAALMKSVTSRGFKGRVVIHDGAFSAATAIQDFAETVGVDLVAMASSSHGLSGAVVGSVAKEIFRTRKWPVWVCGPEASI